MTDIQELKARIKKLENQIESAKIKLDLKKKGDLHLLNIHRFFGRWVEKSDPLRDSIKMVVFGTIYGKSARSLAKDIQTNVLDKLNDEKYNLLDAIEEDPGNKELKSKLREVKAKIEKESDLEPYIKQAKEIVEKLMTDFPQGAKYLEEYPEKIKTQRYVMSPFGRRRNMFRVISGSNKSIAEAGRRAVNSPIQGMCSEIGMQAAYLILMKSYEYILDNDLPLEWMPEFSRTVHDATYMTVRYEFVIPLLHIMQFTSTYGVTKFYEEEFGFKFNIEPEIEMEISSREDKGYSWDWSLPNLIQGLDYALHDQVGLGTLDADELQSTRDTILKPWRSKKTRTWLQENYPLLGVRDLDEEIRAAANLPMFPKKEEVAA